MSERSDAAEVADLLADCLEAVERGQSAEGALRASGAHREELRSLLEVAADLRLIWLAVEPRRRARRPTRAPGRV